MDGAAATGGGGGGDVSSDRMDAVLWLPMRIALPPTTRTRTVNDSTGSARVSSINGMVTNFRPLSPSVHSTLPVLAT
jgi:hypothetical protein